MALPLAIGRFGKPLLFQIKPFKPLQRCRSNLTPNAGWLEKPKSLLFHPENIMKNKDVIPIALFTIVGFTCEVLWIIRMAFTRDDVLFLNKKMACEILETRKGPWYPAPIRKFKVYHDKYENCKGAIAAIQTPEEEVK